MTRAGQSEWRAAAHAALLAGAAALAAPAVATTPEAGFAPPRDQPLILSRTVIRELRDGAAIVATRRYQITFHPVGDGWRVDGTLIASEIDVPPSLAPIAAIERTRSDEGVLPIHLDHAGRIVVEPQPSSMADPKAFAGALRAASHLLPGAASDGFLTQLGTAAAKPGAGLSAWPEALFLPHGLFGVSEQSFRLPDGSDGSVLILLDSDAEPARATMSRARRTVVTQVAGTRQVAREEWTLAPIAGPIKP